MLAQWLKALAVLPEAQNHLLTPAPGHLMPLACADTCTLTHKPTCR